MAGGEHVSRGGVGLQMYARLVSKLAHLSAMEHLSHRVGSPISHDENSTMPGCVGFVKPVCSEVRSPVSLPPSSTASAGRRRALPLPPDQREEANKRVRSIKLRLRKAKRDLEIAGSEAQRQRS